MYGQKRSSPTKFCRTDPKVNSFTGERKEKLEREKAADLRTGDSGCQ